MKFLDPLCIQWTGDNEWILAQELRCVPAEGEQITVPAGLRTDLASTPRVLWTLLPPAGPWARASVLHDYLYEKHTFRREKCDQLFLEAMRSDGVSLSISNIIYRAVRAFGKGTYKRRKTNAVQE